MRDFFPWVGTSDPKWHTCSAFPLDPRRLGERPGEFVGSFGFSGEEPLRFAESPAQIAKAMNESGGFSSGHLEPSVMKASVVPANPCSQQAHASQFAPSCVIQIAKLPRSDGMTIGGPQLHIRGHSLKPGNGFFHSRSKVSGIVLRRNPRVEQKLLL